MVVLFLVFKEISLQFSIVAISIYIPATAQDIAIFLVAPGLTWKILLYFVLNIAIMKSIVHVEKYF